MLLWTSVGPSEMLSTLVLFAAAELSESAGGESVRVRVAARCETRGSGCQRRPTASKVGSTTTLDWQPDG